MKRAAIVFAAIGFLLIGGAGAGTASAQTAPAAAIDPVKLDLARQLVELNGGRQQAEAQMRMMLTALQSSLSHNIPSDESKLLQALYGDLGDEFVKLTPRLLDVSVRIYAENYTEKELRDCLAFQQSESGRSMALKAPKVRAQAINETMPLVMSVLPGVMRRTADRVCDENHCNAHQREVLTKALTQAFQPPAS